MSRAAPRPQSQRTILAIAEAMFAEDGEVSRSRLESHVDDVRDLVSAASLPVRVGLWGALLLIALSPLVFATGIDRLRGFRRLDVDARARVLSRLERTSIAPLSLAFIAWRSVMTLSFYDDATELAAIGYPGAERHRYKRVLAVVAAPVPLESGVRLKSDSAPGEDEHHEHVGHADDRTSAA